MAYLATLELAAKNPVRVAEIYQRLKRAVYKHIIGCPLSESGSQKKSQPWQLRTRGLFSIILAHSNVDEVAGRLSMHNHMCLFSALSPKALERIAEHVVLARAAAAVLDSTVQTNVALELHEDAYARKFKAISASSNDKPPAKSIPGSLTTQQFVYSEDKEAFLYRAAEIQSVCGNHMFHSQACHKVGSGDIQCRMSMSQAPNTHTGPTLLLVDDAGNLKLDQCERDDIPPFTSFSLSECGKNYMQPLPTRDSRLLLWDVGTRPLYCRVAEDEYSIGQDEQIGSKYCFGTVGTQYSVLTNCFVEVFCRQSFVGSLL